MILSLIDKVTTGTQLLELFIWNVFPVVCIAATFTTGGLASGLQDTAGVIDISEIMHPFGHDKSSFFSQLINGKRRDLQQLLKYFNGMTFYLLFLSYT